MFCEYFNTSLGPRQILSWILSYPQSCQFSLSYCIFVFPSQPSPFSSQSSPFPPDLPFPNLFRECFNTSLGPRQISKLDFELFKDLSILSLSLCILVFQPSHPSPFPLNQHLDLLSLFLDPITSC